MAKILISSLGVGSIDRNNTAARAYRTAKYRMNDSDKDYEKSFIASVLYEHLELDGIIFIGTVKSMWEEVYRAFAQETGNDFNEDEWMGLAEQIEKLDLHSSLDSLDLSPVENVLGDRSKCILIKYGLNEAELQENLNRILDIVKYLRKGDELYIDITHSFRSLSIFLLIVLIFLKDLKQEEKIEIKGVFYGMLDVIREVGYAPVVDLKSIFDLTQWIKGAYSLQKFGNGYLISELLKEQGETKLAEEINQLSEVININYVPTIKDRSVYLKQSLAKLDCSSPFDRLKETLEEFTDEFSNRSEPESDFQLKLAGWYFDNKRYATGYITLAEAIVTYACEFDGKDINSIRDRDEMKKLLNPKNPRKIFSQREKEYYNTDLGSLFRKVNPIRNAIAHASFNKKRPKYSDAIEKAKGSYYDQAKKEYVKGYYDQAKDIFESKILR
ncbi:TIGR02221 family CRISPR-associated protein [Roseofilum casamattae]|uniref:TIGR02221 family CRISPR-associated protein n=1 Tax=Roseofilum casamattae BLCC-M143 TaxID=3022442 RepID=A0ABT7BSB8_9CYAN|nr:TIGR02221 family CRISPR-associated protein [Roseofilum casamattae]MDJ1182079.1 TIGR02221 family CRISPR-associated protein [Roseofilum casamattae BLCC-M143]